MTHTDIKSSVFKTCSFCENSWDSREKFLSDPNVRLVGYQAHFEELTAGMFLFNHSCGDTLAFLVEDFRDLYQGPVFEGSKKDTDSCSQYCVQEDNFQPCPIECECSFVREIMQIIHSWKKA